MNQYLTFAPAGLICSGCWREDFQCTRGQVFIFITELTCEFSWDLQEAKSISKDFNK